MDEFFSDESNDDRNKDSFPRIDKELRQKLEGLVPEVIKRTFIAGLGAVFTTEEGIRKLANDFSLPKDVVNYLVQQAQNTKNDLFRIVAGEIRGFLDSIDINQEIKQLLSSMSLVVSTEIKFVPNDDIGLVPKIKKDVKVTREKTESEPEEAEADVDDDQS